MFAGGTEAKKDHEETQSRVAEARLVAGGPLGPACPQGRSCVLVSVPGASLNSTLVPHPCHDLYACLGTAVLFQTS